MVIEAYLRKTPHRMEIVENGREAVEKIKSGRRYDLILMDIQMPVMDGIEATRRIRTLETERHLPRSLIMALSAHAMTNDENKSLAAGCDGHINKPIRKKRLMEVIDRIGGMKGE